MKRRAVKGEDPSLLDYRNYGAEPYQFLIRRGKAKIDRAIRQGYSHKMMERRGIFDSLRHHKDFRFIRIGKPAIRRPNKL